PKPHSYTTDDVVEISAHGSPVVLRHIVELATAAGARLAEPGEFTMRAFLNGRLDLTQAEAVRDLIESQTLFQAKVAAQQLEGSLSKSLKPITFAGRLVDEGASVLIFPEGERTPDGKIHAFRSGAGLLAARLNVPVIPMRIDGLWDLKRAGKRFAAPGRIKVTIGAPLKFGPTMDP